MFPGQRCRGYALRHHLRRMGHYDSRLLNRQHLDMTLVVVLMKLQMVTMNVVVVIVVIIIVVVMVVMVVQVAVQLELRHRHRDARIRGPHTLQANEKSVNENPQISFLMF